MRKYIKNQIQELADTMTDAHYILEREITKDVDKSIQLLVDLQNSAIQIGNEIEKSEGEEHKIITLLVDYCELAWKCSQVDGVQNQRRYIKRLKKVIKLISTQIKNNIPESYEILFLPYKVSMWDALESIWKATTKNNACSAYVVPIPYYEKDPDGSFGEMYYEGEAYPEEVPITHWMEYDIEKRHPDIIFIHNPYDNSNFITSVHPDYYSERLRGLTDSLVFIPYAVSSKDNVAEQFAVIPGTAYANKVITQSETIRRGYISWFRKYEKENGCEGAFGNLETKFCALGSPKFDKVVSTKREDICFPKEWERMVLQSDGTRKKVVLLNTTINQLLLWDDKYLEKLNEDLEKFKSREDILLIWRPHPLLEKACSTMRPQLSKNYTKIVDDYRTQGWGVYDISEDLYSAITFSDAYFGDWSSVATLYQCVGKPVVLRNHRQIYDKRIFQIPMSIRQVGISSFCVDNNIVYLYNSDNDGVYSFNLDAKKAILKTVLPHQTKAPNNGYSQIVKKENLLLFTPNKAPKVIMYDLNTGEYKKYTKSTDPNRDKDLEGSPFPDYTKKVYGEECYWWCNQVGELYKWNPKTKEKVLFCDFSNQLSLKPEGKLDYSIIFSKGCIYALPRNYHPTIENKAFKIDVISEEIKELPELSIQAEPKAEGIEGLICYCDVYMRDDVIYAYSNIRNAMICINQNANIIQEIPVVFDIDSIYRYMKGYVLEGPCFSLEYLLAILCQAEYTLNIADKKELAVSTNIALTQMANRAFQLGELDIGIYHQDGMNGQRILERLLQEV